MDRSPQTLENGSGLARASGRAPVERVTCSRGEQTMPVLEATRPPGGDRPGLDALDFDRLAPSVRQQIRNLCTLDNRHGPLAILFEYALVALCVTACVAGSYWLYPLAVVVIGSTHRFLAHFLHEAAHKTLTRNSRLNLVAGTVFSGYLIFQSFGAYRASHVGSHHRHLGDAESDPDYRFHLECGLYDPATPTRRLVLKEVLASVLGLRIPAYLSYVVRDRLLHDPSGSRVSMPVSPRTERLVFAAQWLLIIGTCAWFGVLAELALFWFVPLLTTNLAIGWLAELAEHYPLPESESSRILLTRNRHGRLVERFLLSRHNDRYHLVHHLNTGVPFWNLGRAHRVLLADGAYARWDDLWAGVLTRPRSRRGRETVVSYATKYRAWRQSGGDPTAGDLTFAQLVMFARDLDTTVAVPPRAIPDKEQS
jgi:fatty acid desaturase